MDSNDLKKNSRQSPEDNGSPPLFRYALIWLVLLTLLFSLYQVYDRVQSQATPIPYSAFVDMVKEGQIAEAEIVQEDMSGRQYVLATTKGLRKLRVDILMTSDLGLAPLLLEHGVAFTYRRSSQFLLMLLSNALPVLLFLGLLWFLFSRQMRAMGQGALSFGKSRARLLAQDRNKVTFKDVAGIDEAKEEVVEIIEFLKDPKKFQKLGGRIPRGVLMVGPPGTGKTLLAKAIAGEAGVPFFSISGSDFVEMFVGVGASRVRDMFDQAKRAAPCIIFIDEIDAVGRSRFSGIGGGHDEREQTLNALLVEMDGMDTREGLIVMAATNRPDVLDPALQRPGRFDRQIVLDLPSLEGREAILKIHARSVPLAKDVDLHRLARGTPGFSGADLANLINEAALLAARNNKEVVTMADLEEARDKVRWGRERRSRVLDEKEKRITAYHEAGHALVSLLVPESEPLHKITIIPRGRALGATMQLPEKDRYLEGRKKLRSLVVLLMAGRATEELVMDDVTSGAANDLKEATRLCRLMVTQWGMSDTLGPQTFGANEEILFLGREVMRQQEYSEETARRIDEEVGRLIRESYEQASALLRAHRPALDAIAQALLERETLDGDEVRRIVDQFKAASASRPAEPSSDSPGAS